MNILFTLNVHASRKEKTAFSSQNCDGEVEKVFIGAYKVSGTYKTIFPTKRFS